VSYQPARRYGLIISILTLEHVGWDEHPREPMKIIWALQNLLHYLNDQREIIITLPVGYNPTVDRLITEGWVRFSELHSLRRISNANQWAECSWAEIVGLHYNSPLTHANGPVFGIFSKN
jgi:hypothetical protein